MTVKLPKLLARENFTVVTVEQFVYQLRAESADYPASSIQESGLLRAINAAAAFIEEYTGHILVGADMQITSDGFPRGELLLGLGPVRELISVSYIDVDSVQQSLAVADIDKDFDTVRPRIFYRDGWPATKMVFNAVAVDVKAGYSAQTDIPDQLQAATLMLATHLHENASATAPVTLNEVPMGVISLANQYRMEWL